MELLWIIVVFCCLENVGCDDTCFGVYDGLVHEFKKGDSWSNKGKCVLHRCKGDNQVAVDRCPEVSVQEGCTLVKEDLTKHFPGCCPYPVCKKTVPVMCVDSDDQSRHHPGDKWQPPGLCVHRECLGRGLTFESRCPTNQLPPGCYYSEVDLTQSFPKCCPKVVCKEKDNSKKK